jgi:plastocyanin
MQSKHLIAIVVTVGTFLAFGHAALASRDNMQTIYIIDFDYQPDGIMFPPGTAVTWANTGVYTHTVTFDDGSIDSGPIAPGQSFSITLSAEGLYFYHCSIHPTMQGFILSRPNKTPPPYPRLWLPFIANE